MVDLKQTLFAIRANSALGRELGLTDTTWKSLDWLIEHKGWLLPTHAQDLQNLHDALAFAPPAPPADRDYWGLLSREIPLTQAQRTQVLHTIAGWVDSSQGGLLDHLGGISPSDENSVSSTRAPTRSPRHAIEQLLAHPRAVELGRKLETALGVLPTATSARELVLTALVLSLDPRAGTPRNAFRGNDLTDPMYWGISPDTVRRSLDIDMIYKLGVKPPLDRAMTYLMLSRIAPQLLVKDLPPTLLYGTHEWMVFSTAVARIEYSAPGSSATMTYKQVMDFGATSPITEQDKANELIARRDALLDWAIINGRIEKKADGEYSAAQIQQAQRDFQHQPSSLVRAGPQLGQPMPTREQVAVADLKRVYGNDIDFSRKVLQATSSNTAFDQNHFYSLLDVHMSGELQAGKWRSISTDFSMAPIEANAGRLHSVNRAFSETFDHYYNDLLRGYNTIVRNLLSQLPQEDRRSLQYGQQTFFSVRKALTGAITRTKTEDSKGREGFIIRSEYDAKVTYYEVFPHLGEIQIRNDLPAHLKVGANTDPFSHTESDARQPFDWRAYRNGEPPRAGESSPLVIERIHPPFTWQRPAGDTTPDLSFLGGKSYELAEFAAARHLIPDKETLRQQARGESTLEMTQRYQKAGAAAVLSLIPFANTLKHAIDGNAADAISSFIIDGATIAIPVAPGLRAVAHNVKSAKTLFSLLKSASRSADDLVGLVAAGKHAKSFYATLPSFGGVRNAAQGVAQGAGLNTAIKSGAENVATGSVRLAGESGEARSILAKFDGVDKWYPVDPSSGDAYGTSLPNFRADTSISVQRETFSDGTQALLLEPPLSDKAYTLPRTNGYDLVDGDKVYRFNPQKPEQLSDLESVEHFKPLDNFEAVCPAPGIGGRVRRGANDECFSKIIADLPEAKLQVQALEHQRLFPSKRKLFDSDRFVVYEKRLHKVIATETGSRLVPVSDAKRITYKAEISATIQDKPGFGFYAAEPVGALEQRSRVVKLAQISEASDDQREMRALIVEQSTPDAKTDYLVVEADTAEFYYAKLGDIRSANVTFKKCTPRELPLVEGYKRQLNQFRSIKQAPIDAAFVSLPKLKDAFAKLQKAGFAKAQVDELKAVCKALSAEQQREIIFGLQRSGAIEGPAIALKPYQSEALLKPRDFSTLSIEQQNRFYAENTKNAVQQSLAATGLGPGNKVLSPKDAARADAANMVIGWLRKTAPTASANRADLVVKSGAGNCGEMSLLARDIIEKTGGRAYQWTASDEHVFTVVGGPSTLPSATTDFSDPVWADAWIVDPWADIACPAGDFTRQLKARMQQWETSGLKIDGSSPPMMSPLHPQWLNALIDRPKTPYRVEYARH